MKKLNSVKLPARSIFKDERGQALVEYILVTPVVMFFFFVILQYMLIMMATQLSNYAVYAAARVYAVQYAANTDGEDEAEGLAKKAAAMVMAPMSGLAPGEVPGWAAIAENIVGLQDELGLPETLSDLVELVEGYALARYWRNDIQFTEPDGSPEQITANLTYKFPVMVPGFKLLWDLIPGSTIDEEINDASTYLQKKNIFVIPGSEDAPALLAPILTTLNGFLNLPLPYVAIRAKCSMGYEPWNGSIVVLEGENVSGGEGGEPEQAVIDYQDCMIELEGFRAAESNAAAAFKTADLAYLDAQNAHYAALKALDDCMLANTNSTCDSRRTSAEAAEAEVLEKKAAVDAAEDAYNLHTAQPGYNVAVAESLADDVSDAYEEFETARTNRDNVLLGTHIFDDGWHGCLTGGGFLDALISLADPKCIAERDAAIAAKTVVDNARGTRDSAKVTYEAATDAREIKSDECEDLGEEINPESE